MRKLKYTLTFTLVLFTIATAIANNALQKTAEELYAQKNYKGAITAYESIISGGYTSYKLHYNLGNAYYKNNEIGKAIYQYELANKLNFNNEDVLNNLRIANDKTIDKIESKENFFLSVIKSNLVNAFSTRGWAWLSIISLICALSFIFLFLISGNIALKRLGFFLGSICFIGFIASITLGFYALNDKENLKYAVIISHEIKALSEPDIASSGKFTLHEGTRVKVMETNESWTNIKLENGNEAWVKTNDIGLF